MKNNNMYFKVPVFILISLFLMNTNLVFSKTENKLKMIEAKMIDMYGQLQNGDNYSEIRIDKTMKELKDLAESVFTDLIEEKKQILFSNLFKIDSLIKVESKHENIRKSISSFLGKYYLFYADSLFSLAINSDKYKIVLFISSVSCICTLDKCADYESRLYDLKYKYKNKFDCMVIDSYLRKDLRDQYKIGYIPTIILFDIKNNEIKRLRLDFNIEDLVGLMN